MKDFSVNINGRNVNKSACFNIIIFLIVHVLLTLCVFDCRQDLLSILTKVNEEVGKGDANFGDGKIFKQCPAPLFTLTKRVFFH